jgi:hypothetical protein
LYRSISFGYSCSQFALRRCAQGSQGENMDARVTKEPVDRDLRRRQLAQRLVTHHARTQTIVLLTGLSRHQLATLRQRWQVTNEMRYRGPPPTSLLVFHSTARMRAEVAALAVFWRILANLGAPKDRSSDTASNIEFGERLCEVFEAYLACFPKAELGLEHLLLLARGLEQADAISPAKCGNCEAQILMDLLGTRRRLCTHCQKIEDAADSKRAHIDGEKSGSNHPLGDEGVQQELF